MRFVGGRRSSGVRPRCSPAQWVDAPGVRPVAGPAVPPVHQLQRRRRAAALRALDGLLRAGPRLADLLRALLVDGPVTPTGASQMCFRAASRPGSDGLPPVGMSCPRRRYSPAPALWGCSPPIGWEALGPDGTAGLHGARGSSGTLRYRFEADPVPGCAGSAGPWVARVSEKYLVPTCRSE